MLTNFSFAMAFCCLCVSCKGRKVLFFYIYIFLQPEWVNFSQVFHILHVSMAHFAYIKRICRRIVHVHVVKSYIIYWTRTVTVNCHFILSSHNQYKRNAMCVTVKYILEHVQYIFTCAIYVNYVHTQRESLYGHRFRLNCSIAFYSTHTTYTHSVLFSVHTQTHVLCTLHIFQRFNEHGQLAKLACMSD